MSQIDPQYDAIVVGSGPNGLAAAITLAQAKLSVLLIEGKSSIGGGMRSAELTLPGFIHDICSAIHPLGISSPFFNSLPLEQYGLKWIQPLAPMAHLFHDGHAVILERSIDETCESLGEDAQAYKKLMQPLVSNWNALIIDLLAPFHFPAHPLLLSRFSYHAIRSAESLINQLFKNVYTRGLFAGLAAHAMMPLDKYLTAAFGLVLGSSGHAVGWPMLLGGTQNLAHALTSYFRSIGGKILTHTMIESIDELPSYRAIFFDVTPQQLLKIVGNRFPFYYRQQLESYRYGPGVFKIDWALSNPVPWKNKDCTRAGTLHIGGTLKEIKEAEQLVWTGKMPTHSFIIMAQPSLFDASRAPTGKHTAWAYCHVPHGSTVDMTKQIESQINQLAPGFMDCILARSTKSTIELEAYNPNYIGGDITGGVEDIYQLFTRPVARIVPYSTPIEGLYICSASTPPGAGVHGMCGYHAARAALKKIFK